MDRFSGDGLGGGPPTAHAQWASGGFRSAGCGASLIGALLRAHEAGIGHFALQSSASFAGPARVSRAAAGAAEVAGWQAILESAERRFSACAVYLAPERRDAAAGLPRGVSLRMCIRSPMIIRALFDLPANRPRRAQLIGECPRRCLRAFGHARSPARGPAHACAGVSALFPQIVRVGWEREEPAIANDPTVMAPSVSEPTAALTTILSWVSCSAVFV